MLFYERRKKKPLQLLKMDKKEADEEKTKDDSKKEEDEERFEVNYQDAVVATERPNRVFEQVLLDNHKFGFENEIYSGDFIGFVLSIQKAALNLRGDDETAQSLRRNAMAVGTKFTLEILAKAFSNSCIDEHVAVLVQIMQADPTNALAREFLETWYDKDGFDFLFSLLLECPDTRARTSVANLLKYVLVSLKI